jgi:8-oxo-dGTP pyrophosphatase MutT (NUDIX family)
VKSGDFSSLVIRDNHGRYLTLKHHKRPAKLWSFAGGKLEQDELPIVAAARELYEELGVVALSLQFIANTETTVNGTVWTGHWYSLGRYYGDLTIQEPQKVSELLWLTADELAQFGAVPEAEIAEAMDEEFKR